MMDNAPPQPNPDTGALPSSDGLWQLLANAAEIFKKYQEVLNKIGEKFGKTDNEIPKFDYKKGLEAIASSMRDVYSDPSTAIALQGKYIDKSVQLINYAKDRIAGGTPLPVYEPDKKDHRFQFEAWQTNLYFDLLKQLYLLNCEWMNDLLVQAQNIDAKTKSLASFFIKQFINASAPTNFFSSNPEVLQEFLSTNGKSLRSGMDNLLADLDRSGDVFNISTANQDAFTLGENIACTPGQVIFKNEMLELISYTPTSTKIYELPLLIVPPFINKYYILDLSKKNSLVRWLVDQGFAVFLISWINPTNSNITFENYLLQGALTALDFILKTFETPKLNVLGYCVGGTLTAMLTAYLAKRGRENIINSASFLTTLTDFSEVGEVGVFIDEETITAIERSMEKTGYYSGDVMHLTFSMLRSNDMIWSFFVNNYLLGKQPMPFDILYWNADSTRLPAKMYSFYLRNMYLENNLIKPGKIVINGTPIDLSTISVPCHFISTQYDHIAPWKSTYAIMNVLNCERTFTLAGSGHVAGIVNPAGSDKYSYRVSNDASFPQDPNSWLTSSKALPGSWWQHWEEWLKQRSGKQISTASHNKIVESLKIEKAPGSYVRTN
jgi:polyhydroxyalkanoate synthase